MPIYYDVSLPISSAMPTWPGDPPVRVEQVSSISQGDAFNVSRLEMSTHVLTHVDAPRHFVEQGTSVDRLSLDVLIGPAVVVEPHPGGNLITATDLGQLGIRNAERVLIKTRNSDFWVGGPYEFETDFVSLSKDAAHWLLSRESFSRLHHHILRYDRKASACMNWPGVVSLFKSHRARLK